MFYLLESVRLLLHSASVQNNEREGQAEAVWSAFGVTDYAVKLCVVVIRVAGGEWELQKLLRGRCYILPCFSLSIWHIQS